jgi:hypothetical protein
MPGAPVFLYARTRTEPDTAATALGARSPPATSGLASAGDMGFTTGRYRVLGRESGEVASTGIFVTI